MLRFAWCYIITERWINHKQSIQWIVYIYIYTSYCNIIIGYKEHMLFHTRLVSWSQGFFWVASSSFDWESEREDADAVGRLGKTCTSLFRVLIPRVPPFAIFLVHNLVLQQTQVANLEILKRILLEILISLRFLVILIEVFLLVIIILTDSYRGVYSLVMLLRGFLQSGDCSCFTSAAFDHVTWRSITETSRKFTIGVGSENISYLSLYPSMLSIPVYRAI